MKAALKFPMIKSFEIRCNLIMIRLDSKKAVHTLYL